jgi:putative peptide zinc metalloprotease protein
MRRLSLFLVSLLLAAALAGVSPAAAWAEESDDGGSADNAAVAINTKDGKSIFDFAFSIRRVAGDVVDETNAAVAYNECEECRAVAVAIQIVLVVGHPSVVTPTNLAVAVNYQCTLCESLAMAYQFVIGVPAGFDFSKDALEEIRRIRQEIKRLGKEDLPLDELRTRIDALADRLRTILRDEIAHYEEREKRRAGDDDRERRPSPPRPPPPSTTTGPAETTTEPAPTVTGETATPETATTTTETTETATTSTGTTGTTTTTP